MVCLIDSGSCLQIRQMGLPVSFLLYKRVIVGSAPAYTFQRNSFIFGRVGQFQTKLQI